MAVTAEPDMYSFQSSILVGPEAAIGGKPPPTWDLPRFHDCITHDRIPSHSHKFRAILANRAGYCIELDSHKGFAA